METEVWIAHMYKACVKILEYTDYSLGLDITNNKFVIQNKDSFKPIAEFSMIQSVWEWLDNQGLINKYNNRRGMGY